MIVKPKRNSLTWDVRINSATMAEFKKKIAQVVSIDLTNVSFIFCATQGIRHMPCNDTELRVMLHTFSNENQRVLTVSIDTASKPFSSWSLSAACELFGIEHENDDDPNIPVFVCGRKAIKSKEDKKAFANLLSELEVRKITGNIYGKEAARAVFTLSFLHNSALVFGDEFCIIPEMFVQGTNGRGPVDVGIYNRKSHNIVGVTEIKRGENGLQKGIGQNLVQLGAIMSNRKRKRDDDEVFGIVTNAEKWFFVQCKKDAAEKLSFALSSPILIHYAGKDFEETVHVVFEHILWLLDQSRQNEKPPAKKKKKKM